jgi:flagellar hook-length control protein FliK
MEDGQLITARLDVNAEQVDVRLAAPEGSSQLAEQRASELRQALASHGMELGEFDVSTSNGQRSETESSGDRRESSSGERNSTSPDAEVDRWGRPVGTENARGSAADGRGALLDLRL